MRALIILAFSVGALAAQPSNPQPISDRDYFSYVLYSIASSETTGGQQNTFLDGYAGQFHLSATERTYLSVLAKEYSTALAAMHATYLATNRAAMGQSMSSAANDQLMAAASAFSAKVSDIGSRFFKYVRPDVATRIRAAIDKSVSIQR